MAGAQNPSYIEFVARLRGARRALQLSQMELGKRVKRNQAFVSKVETCERRLDVIEAAAWCIILGIRLEDCSSPGFESCARQGQHWRIRWQT